MTYSSIEALLTRYDADVGASEAHGIAAGMLCVSELITVDQWLQELFYKQQAVATEDSEFLSELFEKTRTLLGSDSFEFDLFLPDDEEMLSDQAEAIRCWCQGFLFGIGYGRSTAAWPGDSGEILKDVVEFTKLDDSVHGEDDEADLIEINEYLRAAVLLLRDDLRGNSGQTH